MEKTSQWKFILPKIKYDIGSWAIQTQERKFNQANSQIKKFVRYGLKKKAGLSVRELYTKNTKDTGIHLALSKMFGMDVIGSIL